MMDKHELAAAEALVLLRNSNDPDNLIAQSDVDMVAWMLLHMVNMRQMFVYQRKRRSIIEKKHNTRRSSYRQHLRRCLQLLK